LVARFWWWAFTVVFGWKPVGAWPEEQKAVVVCWPHTSYWDSFYIYMMSLATLGFGLTKANWMGKFFVYWLPVWTVVRNKQMSQTKSVAKHFERYDRCWLYMALAGTTAYTDHVKSGFFYIAQEANVPVRFGNFNYKDKTFRFSDAMNPAEMTADECLEKMRGWVKECGLEDSGLYPHKSSKLVFKKKD